MNTVQQPFPGVPWFDLADPTSSALDELAGRFHLHDLQIEDCRHRSQRAKVDEYESYVFAVLKHVVHRDQKLMFDDFDVFLGPNFLITVHQGQCSFFAKICQHMNQNRVDRLDRIFHVITDLIVDEYLAFAGQISRGHRENRVASTAPARAASAA
ncbi:MAG: CorA family divalent cation transporter [Acidobacteriota bacterium]